MSNTRDNLDRLKEAIDLGSVNQVSNILYNIRRQDYDRFKGNELRLFQRDTAENKSGSPEVKQTILMYAVSHSRPDPKCIEALLEYTFGNGIKCDITDSNGDTAVQLMLRNPNLPVADKYNLFNKFIEKTYEVSNMLARKGYTRTLLIDIARLVDINNHAGPYIIKMYRDLLANAVNKNNLEHVQAILRVRDDLGICWSDLNDRFDMPAGYSNYQPKNKNMLMFTCHTDSPQIPIVQAQLETRALDSNPIIDVNATTQNGETALHLLLANENIDVQTKYIIMARILDYRDGEGNLIFNVNGGDCDRNHSLLMLVARYGNLPMLQYLLDTRNADGSYAVNVHEAYACSTAKDYVEDRLKRTAGIKEAIASDEKKLKALEKSQASWREISEKQTSIASLKELKLTDPAEDKEMLRLLTEAGAVSVANGDSHIFYEQREKGRHLRQFLKPPKHNFVVRHPNISLESKDKTQVNQIAQFNANPQNTHDVGLTITVTNSIKRLTQRYFKKENENKVQININKLKAHIQALPNKPEVLAERQKIILDSFANLCEEKSEMSKMKHPDTQFTLSEILTLVWEGIEDTNARPREMEDKDHKITPQFVNMRKEALMDALYKTALEYGKKGSGCFMGALNDVVSVLHGAHADVFIIASGNAVRTTASEFAVSMLNSEFKKKPLSEQRKILREWSLDSKTTMTSAEEFRSIMCEVVRVSLVKTFGRLLEGGLLDEILANFDFLPRPIVHAELNDLADQIDNEIDLQQRSDKRVVVDYLLNLQQEVFPVGEISYADVFKNIKRKFELIKRASIKETKDLINLDIALAESKDINNEHQSYLKNELLLIINKFPGCMSQLKSLTSCTNIFENSLFVKMVANKKITIKELLYSNHLQYFIKIIFGNSNLLEAYDNGYFNKDDFNNANFQNLISLLAQKPILDMLKQKVGGDEFIKKPLQERIQFLIKVEQEVAIQKEEKEREAKKRADEDNAIITKNVNHAINLGLVTSDAVNALKTQARLLLFINENGMLALKAKGCPVDLLDFNSISISVIQKLLTPRGIAALHKGYITAELIKINPNKIDAQLSLIENEDISKILDEVRQRDVAEVIAQSASKKLKRIEPQEVVQSEIKSSDKEAQLQKERQAIEELALKEAQAKAGERLAYTRKLQEEARKAEEQERKSQQEARKAQEEARKAQEKKLEESENHRKTALKEYKFQFTTSNSYSYAMHPTPGTSGGYFYDISGRQLSGTMIDYLLSTLKKLEQEAKVTKEEIKFYQFELVSVVCGAWHKDSNKSENYKKYSIIALSKGKDKFSLNCLKQLKWDVIDRLLTEDGVTIFQSVSFHDDYLWEGNNKIKPIREVTINDIEKYISTSTLSKLSRFV